MKKLLLVESKYFDEHPEFDWKPAEFYFETKDGQWLKLNPHQITEITLPTESDFLAEIKSVIAEIAPRSKWETKDKMTATGLRVVYWLKSKIMGE